LGKGLCWKVLEYFGPQPREKKSLYPNLSSKEHPIRVLSASVDHLLSHCRALFLRRCGFEVTTSSSKEHAREQLDAATYDVLIFGTTLSRDACLELAECFRKRNSRGKIIEVVPSEAPIPKNQPDAIVASADEPAKLVTTIYAQVT
jgi:hypothetical protein